MNSKTLKVLSIALLSATTLASCGGGASDGTTGLTPTTPSLKISDFATPEGAAEETSVATFRVSLAPASDATVTFDYLTNDVDALAGEDYLTSAGTLSFAPGETAQFINVDVIGDDSEEARETFTVNLSNIRGAQALNSQAVGSIANDDSSCDFAPGAINPWLEPDRLLLNYSHRGGAEDYPENTLYAYKKSVEVNADVLEMDVFENADGELIVIHDSSVNRTTNQSGDVSSFTTAELKAMDAAFWFVPSVGTTTSAEPDDYVFRGIATGERTPPFGFDVNDFTIPTLEEILQTFPNQLLNIELKPDPDSTGSYAIKVADLMLKYGRNDDVMIASFIDEPATEFKVSAPCVSTSFPTAQAAAAISQSQTTGIILNPAGHHAFQVPTSLGIEIVTPEFIENAHEANIAVHVFTIDDCQEMVDLLDIGVDGIMTDRPILLSQLLAQEPGTWSCDSVIWPLEQ